ncbi:hypothetical protein Tco_0849735 [Tanacetum coccineum]
MLMKDAISIIGRSANIFRISSDMMRQLPPEPSRQEAFEELVMNFILDQEEKVKQLEEYMGAIGSDFMQLSSEVVGKLKEEIRMEESRTKKIEKITRYPNTEDLKPLNGHKFLEALTEKASFHTPKFVSPKLLCVKYVRTTFPSPPLEREKNPKIQSTPQVLLSFEEYTLLVTHLKEVEKTIGISIELEPLHEPQLEDLGLNTYNHDIPLYSREVPSLDEPKPQPQPLPNCPSLDDKRGPNPPIKPPIKPLSLDSFRMKVVDKLTINTPHSPYMVYFYPKDMYCYYHPCIDDPKKHYGFKPGLLGQSGSLGVNLLNMVVI